MIENFGIGIDIVDINRFEKITYAEKPSFYNKLFTSSEIEYCLKFKTPAQHFAGKFAIKESLKKSIDEPISFFLNRILDLISTTQLFLVLIIL